MKPLTLAAVAVMATSAAFSAPVSKQSRCHRRGVVAVTPTQEGGGSCGQGECEIVEVPAHRSLGEGGWKYGSMEIWKWIIGLAGCGR